MGMFGLDDDKKKPKEEEFLFDLERDLKGSDAHKELVDLVESRAQTVKGLLQRGEDKEMYAKLGTLLHGYASLIKVMGKTQKKSRLGKN